MRDLINMLLSDGVKFWGQYLNQVGYKSSKGNIIYQISFLYNYHFDI